MEYTKGDTVFYNFLNGFKTRLAGKEFIVFVSADNHFYLENGCVVAIKSLSMTRMVLTEKTRKWKT